MIDIVSIGENGIGVYDTQTERAKNILSVQVGSLEYDQDLGIDLKYFLSEDFRFQDASFKSYLVQVLSNYGINVSSLVDMIEDLSHVYTFNLTPAESEDSMISR